ncbi:hypothetical protein [Natronomonas sp. EA1]|uniref:hypothetical protein n=1 Tax=Natronomonas sp. EA1 TaxID=3421655 RepID=UPI003EBF6EA7
MRLRRVVHGSKLSRVLGTLRRWSEGSVAVALVTNERVQQGALALLLLFSSASVLGSSMDASVKFLSFVALFAVVTALVWSVAGPFGNGSETDATQD